MTYNGPLILLTDDDSMIETLNTTDNQPSDDVATVHVDGDRRILASQTVVGCCQSLPDVALLTVAPAPCSPPISPRSPADRERAPLLVRPGDSHPENAADYNSFPDDVEYSSLLNEAEQAIEHGIYPQRIKQGSSGSYFVKNHNGVRLFVVKFCYKNSLCLLFIDLRNVKE